jgi:hypothetical protein
MKPRVTVYLLRGLLCAVLLFGWLPAAAQNPVIVWNGIAQNTIVNVAGKNPAASTPYFAYVQAAVYDAVNSIDGRYQAFAVHIDAPQGASQDAAAVAAAHRVLVTLFPAQQSALDASYASSLSGIPDGYAKATGIAVGENAATSLLALRAGDGLEASVSVVLGSGPGAWQPTSPAPPVSPWVGQLKPFTYSSPSQFLPEGPTPLDSEKWVDDYNLTRLYGAKTGSLRTPQQTEIGLFWTEHTPTQYNRAFRGLALQQGLNTAESARLLAMVDIAGVDALVGCMNAKYHYMFWRPVTAIRAGGGNPSTVADPTWEPSATTPNHPEYPSNHACVTSAIVRTLQGFFGTDTMNFTVDSLVTNTVHNFTRFSDVRREVAVARIYGGMHYHHSMMEGTKLGKKVANHMLAHFFRPLDEVEKEDDD